MLRLREGGPGPSGRRSPNCASESLPLRSPLLRSLRFPKNRPSCAKLRSPGRSDGVRERSSGSPERFRSDFRTVFRSLCVRFRRARARATEKARHAFRPVKTNTKRMSAVPRATQKSRKIVRKSIRKRVRARTSRKTPSDRCPTRLGSVPGRSGVLGDPPRASRERPGSAHCCIHSSFTSQTPCKGSGTATCPLFPLHGHSPQGRASRQPN